MGNTLPNDMSYDQSYTGMSPNQMISQMDNIPNSLKTNFYTEVV